MTDGPGGIGGGGGGLGGLGGLGAGMFGEILKQAQDVQAQMARRMEELKAQTVDGEAGGGMVKVTVNGRREVVAVKIDKSALDNEGLEMIEDLLVAAANIAIKKAEELEKSEIQKATGGLAGGLAGMGLDIPGITS